LAFRQSSELLLALPRRTTSSKDSGPFLDVLAQSVIDQGLIVAAAGFVNLATKPVENLVVQTDRDAALAARR
jgi:hypothetical protein